MRTRYKQRAKGEGPRSEGKSRVTSALRPSPFVLLLVVILALAGGMPREVHAQEAILATTQEEETLIDSLLALMTLEEKLGQLTQVPSVWAQTGPAAPPGSAEEIRAGRIGSFLSVYGAETTRELQRVAVEESRLGIPLLFAHDVIHGFRTIFPVPLAEAASFDPEAVEQAARVAAVEASAAGVHWTFAPMVDVARDARWGRIVEGSGEDPYLGSVLAAARVHGFQGEDLAAANTVLACAKHFAAYGAAEAGRDYNTVDLSMRTLWEVYLPPFKAALDAGVATFMTAFNEIGGVPATASHYLFTEVLREMWGFDGLVVSDYTAVWELLHHGVAADSAHAGALALEAGVDVDMVSTIYLNALPPLIASGEVPMTVVDDAVRRVLRAKVRVGLFEDPYRYSDPDREAATLLAEEHLEAARTMAQKNIVLLKNDGVLPLSKDVGSLAVVGVLAEDARSTLGSWAAAGRAEESMTVLDGIRAAVPNAMVTYAPGVPDVTSTDTTGFAEAVAAAEGADAVVLVLGERQDMSGEAASRASIDLPGVQQQLAERVLATGTPAVVVLMNGRPLAIPELDAQAPAILETWFLGTEMAHAVADVLFGDVNPGGSLPVTFPRTVGQVPIYYNHKPTGRPPRAEEKYTSKYLDVPWTPLYPFGHGLSYTTFSYDNLRLSQDRLRADETLTVQVDVTNTGDRAGDEVVQLYIRDEVASVTQPVKALRGFERITLEPGETRTVTFELGADDLALYNLAMDRVVEPGWFTVYAGPSSAEGLEARFEVIE